jgi:N-dimethylarginine dimethylaminohydrolase
MAQELEKRGVEVIRTPYGEVFQFGGSFRCSYPPLVRED